MDKRNLQLIWLRGYGNLKADAQSSYLGSLWWLLDPLLMSGLMYLAFSTGLRGNSGSDFFIFLIFGMIPLKWTQSCLQSSATVITRNKGLLGQVYFPKWVFPTFNVLSQTLRYLVVIPLLIAISVFFVESSPTNDWVLIAILITQLFLNLGISYCVASIVPIVPDISHIVGIISMGLMFTSGVFFDITTRPEHVRAILELNPMVDLLRCYRNVLIYDQPVLLTDFQYPISFAFITLLIGAATLKYFDRIYPRII
ncbi:ABC transporter permease [Halioxenophilus aromaticivorans]|uniref:ABC transporter permease n=1 Tax=Halioxenophilus aromaticivorans TaxID=1306992 RepID=UPI0031EBF456